MAKYRINWQESYSVEVEAQNDNEAREKWANIENTTPNSTDFIEIQKVEE